MHSNIRDYVYLETSSYCNLNCTYCHRTLHDYENKNKNIELSTYFSIIDKLIFEGLVNERTSLFLHGFGEPTIHPKLPELINYAARKNNAFGAIQFVTNAAYCGFNIYNECFKNGLTNLYVSLDSTEPEYLKKTRINTNYELLFDNIEQLARHYTEKFVVISVLTHENIDHLPLLASFLEKNAVKQWNIQLLHDYGKSFSFSETDLQTALQKINTSNLKINFEGFPYPKCTQPLTTLVFNVMGDVLPCCIDYSPSIGYYGNIKQSSIKACLNSLAAQTFVSEFNKGKNRYCLNCAYYGKD